MNRRSFLTSLIGGVAAGAAVRAWPFRVFSFPSEIARRPAFRIPTFGRGISEDLLARQREIFQVTQSRAFWMGSHGQLWEIPGPTLISDNSETRGQFTISEVNHKESTITVVPG